MYTKNPLQILAMLLLVVTAIPSYAEKVVVVPLFGGTDYTVAPPLELRGPQQNVIGLAETEISQPSQNIAFIIKLNGSVPRRSFEIGTDVVTPFVGQIVMWGGTYPPKGWAFADGQQVAVSSFPNLFSVLSFNYGGNGTTLFKLPDLRGRVPVHYGFGPGLTNRVIGVKFGSETIGN